ncbi:MAG: hypothetical protein J7K14_09865 [Sulfurimonas sp.]|nr:hypothetical protein [Sulfurimonas sp.]
MELMVKKYQPKDMIFNNGMVNLYRFLEDKGLDIEIEFNSSSLLLSMDEQKSEEIYFQILEGFFKQYKIVHQTKNDRWYFDEKKQDFILDKKFDTVGGQKNDLRNGVYLYKKISEFGLEREYVEGLYLNFCEKYNQKVEQNSNGTLKVPNKNNEVIVAITLDVAIERFTQYFVNSDTLKRDSKIHSFEDGQGYFQDMVRQPKNYKIDKWDALIYWFGGRVQRFYNRDYFIYPNSSNLNALEKFKEFLNIDDERIVFRDDKEKLISTTSNIDFYKKLERDNIYNKYFYISNSEAEFEVKFFMYLFSIIYHIEEQYEKANRRRKATKKEIYDALQQITFVVYTDDGTFKTSFNEYTKAYQLIKFFELLKESELFDYLANILVTFSMSQGSKEVNLNLQKWCQNILSFSNLRKVYYLTSFNILKNDSKSFGKKLFEFEKLYLKNILGEKDMNIHEQSKKLGDGIGHYCAELGDKDLLFKLRNVKNYKQLIGYFKDLKFSILKNEGKAKFSKEFNESLSETLEDIEPNWEIIRDYIAIYAIDKYRAVAYAKSNKGDK